MERSDECSFLIPFFNIVINNHQNRAEKCEWNHDTFLKFLRDIEMRAKERIDIFSAYIEFDTKNKRINSNNWINRTR